MTEDFLPRNEAAFRAGTGIRFTELLVPYSPNKNMAHCLLSYKEARELERDGRTPDCRQHRHMPAKDAKAKVLDGTYRFVGPRDNRIVPCEAKEWAKAPSMGFSVLQMRRVFREKKLTSARHYGDQCGKQPRVSNTQCRDVNGSQAAR